MDDNMARGLIGTARADGSLSAVIDAACRIAAGYDASTAYGDDVYGFLSEAAEAARKSGEDAYACQFEILVLTRSILGGGKKEIGLLKKVSEEAAGLLWAGDEKLLSHDIFNVSAQNIIAYSQAHTLPGCAEPRYGMIAGNLYSVTDEEKPLQSFIGDWNTAIAYMICCDYENSKAAILSEKYYNGDLTVDQMAVSEALLYTIGMTMPEDRDESEKEVMAHKAKALDLAKSASPETRQAAIDMMEQVEEELKEEVKVEYRTPDIKDFVDRDPQPPQKEPEPQKAPGKEPEPKEPEKPVGKGGKGMKAIAIILFLALCGAVAFFLGSVYGDDIVPPEYRDLLGGEVAEKFPGWVYEDASDEDVKRCVGWAPAGKLSDAVRNAESDALTQIADWIYTPIDEVTETFSDPDGKPISRKIWRDMSSSFVYRTEGGADVTLKEGMPADVISKVELALGAASISRMYRAEDGSVYVEVSVPLGYLEDAMKAIMEAGV